MRDNGKVKPWLYMTMHRAFLERKRRETRFPHLAQDQADSRLPRVLPSKGRQLDVDDVMDALEKIDDVFRAPLALFYLEDYPYEDIADILNIPLGTVKSRIARGIKQLKTLLIGESEGLSHGFDRCLTPSHRAGR